MSKDILLIAQKLGIDNEELKDIMENTTPQEEIVSETSGPDTYMGAWYATVSILDF